MRNKLTCTAEELYAARCGVLHTLTPNSELSEFKGVRKIAYAWGNTKHADLAESITAVSMDYSIASVHLEDLFSTFKDGFADYLDEAFSNKVGREKFLTKSGKHFANINMEQMDEFLRLARENKT